MSKNYELLRRVEGERRLAPPPAHAMQAATFSDSVADPLDEGSVTTYLHALRRRKWTVIGVTAASVFLVGLISLLITPTYEAVARIGIYRESQGDLALKQETAGAAAEEGDYTVALDTQAKIIEGDAFAGEVVRKLGLDRNTEFVSPAAIRRGTGFPEAVKKFQANLAVVNVPHTRLLEIRYSSPNPRRAADVANAAANAYIDHAFIVRHDTTAQASNRLAGELADLQAATDKSEAKLIAYQRTHRMIGADELIASRLADLSKDLTAVEVERNQKQAEYNLVRTNQPDRVGRVEANGLLERLRARESELTTEYAKDTSFMGPANPRMIELKDELEDVRRAIAAELGRMRRRVTSEYEVIQQREAWLQKALEAEKHEAAQHREDAIQYNNLKRDADTNRQLYTDLLQKLKEAQLTSGLQADNIRIEALATIPQKPAKPNILFNLALALCGGVVLASAVALARESFNSSIQSAEQATIISGAPTLGMIPKVPELMDGGSRLSLVRRNRTNEQSRLQPALVEPYRALRSLMLLQFTDRSWRVLLVTSPLPGEGKTTTAINIASAFAQSNRRILLVDADLRKSAVHHAVGLTAAAEGLSTVLRNPEKLDQALLRWPEKDNLFILPAGPEPDDAAELLGNERMAGLLSALRQRFDYIILDAPPVLGVADSLVMAGTADAVLLVVKESSTPKHALARTRDLLQRTRVPEIGVVVNAVDESNPSHRYYYGYNNKSYRAG